jgi:hypothetical protein
MGSPSLNGCLEALEYTEGARAVVLAGMERRAMACLPLLFYKFSETKRRLKHPIARCRVQ